MSVFSLLMGFSSLKMICHKEIILIKHYNLLFAGLVVGNWEGDKLQGIAESSNIYAHKGNYHNENMFYY